MKPIVLIAAIISGLFLQCSSDNSVTKKVEKLVAENQHDFGSNMSFKLYSDSTYIFIIHEQSPNYEKTEKFDGFCQLANDTIYFTPFQFKPANSQRQSLKTTLSNS